MDIVELTPLKGALVGLPGPTGAGHCCRHDSSPSDVFLFFSFFLCGEKELSLCAEPAVTRLLVV